MRGERQPPAIRRSTSPRPSRSASSSSHSLVGALVLAGLERVGQLLDRDRVRERGTAAPRARASRSHAAGSLGASKVTVIWPKGSSWSHVGLAALVELEQREQRVAQTVTRSAPLTASSKLKRAAAQQVAQDLEALGERDPRRRGCG